MAISSPIAAQRKDLSFRANECESRNLRIRLTYAVESVPGSLDYAAAPRGMTSFIDFRTEPGCGWVNSRVIARSRLRRRGNPPDGAVH